MLSLLFSLYPIAFLSLGNLTRLFLLPTIIINLFIQIKNNKISYQKYIPSIFIFIIIYNSILSLLNGGNFLKLGFNNIQIITTFFFAICSIKLADRYTKLLTYSSYFICGFVIVCFALNLMGFDIKDILLLSKYTDHQAYLKDPYGPTKLEGFYEDLLSRISFGNSTNMCIFLFCIFNIRALINKNIFKNIFKILILISTFLISGSRTFTTLFSLFFILNYFSLLNLKITSKKIFLILFFILFFLFYLLSSNQYFFELITNFLRFDNLDLTTILSREIERLFYYQSFFLNFNDYFFLGKGPGASYEFVNNLIFEDKSTDSLYLAMFIDYGFLPSITILLSLFFYTIRINRYLFVNYLIFLLGGIVIPFTDSDIFYIYLGIILNPSIINNLNSLKN